MDKSSITVRWILSTTERFCHSQPFESGLLHTSTPSCLLSVIYFHSSAETLVGNVLTVVPQAFTSAPQGTRRCTLAVALLVIVVTNPLLRFLHWLRPSQGYHLQHGKSCRQSNLGALLGLGPALYSVLSDYSRQGVRARGQGLRLCIGA